MCMLARKVIASAPYAAALTTGGASPDCTAIGICTASTQEDPSQSTIS